MQDDYAIKVLNASDIDEALRLAWDVFAAFEDTRNGPVVTGDYAQFFHPSFFKAGIENETHRLWGCIHGEQIVGVLACRLPFHISLLFVDARHHRRGIAKAMLQEALRYHIVTTQCREATVHASPYAVDAYHRLGFVDTGAEQTINGLLVTPMKLVFR